MLPNLRVLRPQANSNSCKGKSCLTVRRNLVFSLLLCVKGSNIINNNIHNYIIFTTNFFARRLQQYSLASGCFAVFTGFPITSTACPASKFRSRLIFSLKPSPLLAEMELTVMFIAFCNSNLYFLMVGSLDSDREIVEEKVRESTP